MTKYRAAIIGLGRMGSTIDREIVGHPSFVPPMSIAGGLTEMENVDLVAGCDLVEERRTAFQEKWGVEAVYEDFQEMLAKEAPDLVAICTKAENHAELTVAVAETGVRMIFCEKAIACSMKEADAVLAACQKGNVAFNTGVLRRFDEQYHGLRKVIADGEIGDVQGGVHHARSSLLHGHIHSVDTLLYLLGDPKAVSVWGELWPRDTDLASNRLDHDPSAIYQVELEGGLEIWTIPCGQWDFDIYGTEGVAKAMNNGGDWAVRKRQPIGDTKFTRIAEVDFVPPPHISSTIWLLQDIVNAHEQGKATLGNVEITHHATEICLAVAESRRQGGKRISLPLENRELYVFHV